MKKGPEVRYSIQNTGLGRRALVEGVDQTREYLKEVGATAGLAWTPLVRSRLYGELLMQARNDSFTNVADSVGLIASMEQSFAPTVPEALQRFKDRAGQMSFTLRAAALALNLVQQRGVMPPVLKSLHPMKRVAGIVHDERMFANMYAEELPADRRYTDHNAPYTRSQIITPDVVEKLGTTMAELPATLAERGITHLSFGGYDAARRSQSGQTELPAWEGYSPELASQGLIRQVRFSLNRADLPTASGEEARIQTYDLAAELVKDEPSYGRLGPLQEQVACIVGNTPDGLPLDFTITGNVSGMQPDMLRTAYHNLGQLAAAA